MWLAREHNRTFLAWFKEKVFNDMKNNPDGVSDTIKWLAYEPKFYVNSYEGYDINGYCFYTKRQDDKSTMQNSGVTLQASTSFYASVKDSRPLHASLSYYGVVEDIWELDYTGFKVPVYRCNWFDHNKGIHIDDEGFTIVNFEKLAPTDEPFILASQARQVFYVKDPTNPSNAVVLHGKRQFIPDNTNELEFYANLDDSHTFSYGSTNNIVDETTEHNYARADVEGIWVDAEKQKKK